jgi:predicted PurR-regulated permease PerM
MPMEKDEGWLTRGRVRSLAFAALAALFAYLAWLLVAPLAAPIAWALALAVIAHPLQAWLVRRLKFKSLAAGLVTALVAVTLVAPATLAGRQIAQEAVAAAKVVQDATRDGRWHDIVDRSPFVATAFAWIDATIDLRAQLGKLSERVPGAVQAFMSGSLRFLIGAGVALFLLFFSCATGCRCWPRCAACCRSPPPRPVRFSLGSATPSTPSSTARSRSAWCRARWARSHSGGWTCPRRFCGAARWR